MIRGRLPCGRRRICFAFACLVVPLGLRGPANGAAELIEYYIRFPQGTSARERSTRICAGQNVAGLVSRMTRPDGARIAVRFNTSPMSERSAERTYAALWVTILALLLGKLVMLRLRGSAVSAYELAMVFLAAMLLSPITFTTHLVPLLFIFAVLLSVRRRRFTGSVWLVAVVLGLGVASAASAGGTSG